MLKITSKDIQKWTEEHKKDAENYLPELVRRLLVESCKISNLHIPSWDSTASRGYDGLVDILEENPFLPIGNCVIECWTDENIRKKANTDYLKRKEDPKCNPSETNFVFVTSRLFTKAIEWQNEKNAERFWKSVKAVNADDLEAWLDTSPSACIWFAEIAKLWPSWMLSIPMAWENFRLFISKGVAESLVLLDREKEMQNLLSALKKGWQKIEVQSDSKLESYWFILATLKNSPDFLDKTIVLSNQEQWDFISKTKTGMVLIWKESYSPGNIWFAIAQGHSIIISSKKEASIGNSFDPILLQKMSRENRIKGLAEIIGDQDIAQEIYTNTKWYFYPILRNKELGPNENYVPSWLSKFEDSFLLSLLFLTEWEEWKDNEIVSACFWKDYTEIQNDLITLSQMDDSPIRKIGNVWQVVSKDDLWAILWQKISSSLIERFKSITYDVLTDDDTSTELSKKDRWAAAIYKKWTKYSTRIKRWISDSLALLSATGDVQTQDIIDSIIFPIFNSTVTPYKILYNIGWNLQYLTEASPKIFLEFIEKNINEFDELFASSWNFLFSKNDYVHLLWSLEILAWNPDYLPTVTDILIKLSERYETSIPGNHNNRPMESLSEIFLFWQRWTSETMENKLSILDNCSKKQPQVIFNLIINIINKTISSPTANPKYQDWKSILWPISHKELHDYVAWALKIAINIFKILPENTFIALLENINSFPKNISDEVLDTLLTTDYSTFQNQSLICARKTIEELLTRAVLYKGRLEVDKTKILHLYDLLAPTDETLWLSDLFSNHTKFVISRIDEYKWLEWEGQERIANEERLIAVEKLFKEYWFEWIRKIILQNNSPALLINAILDSKIKDTIYQNLYSLLWEDDPILYLFWINILNVLFIRDSTCEAKKLASFEAEKSMKIRWRFLASLSKVKIKLDILKKQNNETKDIFWDSLKSLNWWNIIGEKDYSEANYIVEELNSRWMYNISFRLIETMLHDWKLSFLETEKIFFTLNGLISFLNNNWRIHNLEFVIEKILDYLYWLESKSLIDKTQICNLEIQYIELINSPKMLNRELSGNPDLFVDIMTKAFQGENEDTKIPSEEERIISRRAHTILFKFHTIPWIKSDGTIDKNELSTYVDRTIQLFRECNRYKIWSQRIWEILSYSPIWSDGIWPCEIIRDIIDKQNNEDINIWFAIWKRNQRGITCRSPFDWWVQEREIAKKYHAWAKKLHITHRITSRILREIWDEYLKESLREDERVDIDL